MEQIHIGLIGCGTVGTGVARILLQSSDLLASRVGASLKLKYVADLDMDTDRGIVFDEGVFISDAQKILEDPEIDIVLEMIGGEDLAKDFIMKALENGKHVVTANKALLASCGNELIDTALRNNVDLAFEASVGGCMPIIKTIRESLVGNRLTGMIGILNGTCNYILSKITDEGIPFKEALAEAQAKGYAEADPTLDVEGLDTAHKLALLISLAYGMEINLRDVYIEGISQITPMDITFAEQFGYKIKLLAIGKKGDSAVEARVHPTMIPADNMLSNVNGTLNAVAISGDAVGDLVIMGHGAGMLPTASAVVSDIVDLTRNMISGAGNRIPPMSYQNDHISKIPILPIQDITTYYYFRFAAVDQPGVLSKISGVLGKHQISIKSVHQKGRKTEGSVPIVMLTHKAKEADVRQALSDIAGLDVVSDEPMLIRIENNNGDE